MKSYLMPLKEWAKLSIFDPGFLYGQGVFETMRSYNQRVFRLDSHIERLLKACPILNIKFDWDANSLKQAVKKALKENNLKDAYLRLTVWQGEDRVNIAIFAKSYNFFKQEAYQKGFKAIISHSFRQNEFSPLAQLKSANYLHLLLAYQEAKRNNADEALLLNTQGFLAEASRANIFLVKDNCLLTPSLESGCLPGITRDTVLAIARKQGLKTIEGKVSLEDLRKCDEAFLTNSLIEVMPLVAIDNKPIKKGLPGKISEVILKGYRGLV